MKVAAKTSSKAKAKSARDAGDRSVETAKPLFRKADRKKPNPKRRSARAKWGGTVINRGFTMVPAILIRAQHRLGLSCTQFTVLLNIVDWWMDADELPWTSKETISDRTGISARQIQRQLGRLEKLGFIRRVPHKDGRGKRPNRYDLKGLVEKLQELAPQFKRAAAANRSVEKKGRNREIS
jgi:hypothetical protein